MPNKTKQVPEFEEVPQVRDETTPRTILIPKEVEEDDVPMTGYLVRNEEKPISFKELITSIIEKLNNAKRVNAMPVPGNMVYGRKTRQIENGGRIKPEEI